MEPKTIFFVLFLLVYFTAIYCYTAITYKSSLEITDEFKEQVGIVVFSLNTVFILSIIVWYFTCEKEKENYCTACNPDYR